MSKTKKTISRWWLTNGLAYVLINVPKIVLGILDRL
jgi:hypothetical protein